MKTCTVCEHEFKPACPHQVVCSEFCRKIHRSRIEMERRRNKKDWRGDRVCVECGKTFSPNVSNQIRCSKECVKEYHKKYIKEYER